MRAVASAGRESGRGALAAAGATSAGAVGEREGTVVPSRTQMAPVVEDRRGAIADTPALAAADARRQTRPIALVGTPAVDVVTGESRRAESALTAGTTADGGLPTEPASTTGGGLPTESASTAGGGLVDECAPTAGIAQDQGRPVRFAPAALCPSAPRPSSSQALRAAFRAAEKRLRIRRGVPPDARRQRRASAKGVQELPSDLSEVVELEKDAGACAGSLGVQESEEKWGGGGELRDDGRGGAARGEAPTAKGDGVHKGDGLARPSFRCSRVALDDADADAIGLKRDALAFSFPAVPGLFVIRSAVAPRELSRLAVEALETYSEPPFPTNLSVEVELAGKAEQRGMRLWHRALGAQGGGQGGARESGPTWKEGAGRVGGVGVPRPAVATGNADESAVSSGDGATGRQDARDEPRPDSPATVPAAASSGKKRGLSPPATTLAAEPAIADPAAARRSQGASPSSPTTGASSYGSSTPSGKPLRPQTLDRLRWSCLGPYYDWTARAYIAEHEQGALPPWLGRVGVRIFGVLERAVAELEAESAGAERPAGEATAASARGLPLLPPSYRPDGALVNFYSRGDVLCGHADDAEPDLSHPLVAISVGPPAVFLAGALEGGDVDKPVVVPFWVRHGDAVVLAGPARLALHGIARVEAGADGGRNVGATKSCNGPREGTEAESEPHLTPDSDPDLPPAVREYLLTHRISVSLRVVT